MVAIKWWGEMGQGEMGQAETTKVTSVDVNGFRRRRFARALAILEGIAIDKSGPIRILDVGGTVAYWRGLEPLWRHLGLDITILNIDVADSEEGDFKIRRGDACNLDRYPDGSFDFVHSNSVLEHVGSWERIRAMASEIDRLAPSHFVQTPNFMFPYEPHFRTLFFQWYPEIVRAKMLMRKSRGFYPRLANLHEAMSAVQGVYLLSYSQLAELFPQSRVEKEIVLGFTKSLIAVRKR